MLSENKGIGSTNHSFAHPLDAMSPRLIFSAPISPSQVKLSGEAPSITFKEFVEQSGLAGKAVHDFINLQNYSAGDVGPLFFWFQTCAHAPTFFVARIITIVFVLDFLDGTALDSVRVAWPIVSINLMPPMIRTSFPDILFQPRLNSHLLCLLFASTPPVLLPFRPARGGQGE